MVAWHYPPVVVDGESNVGRNEHQDSNCVTIVFQDQVGGLQVKKDGAWIPVPIVKGALVVNIGVIIQVFTFHIYDSACIRMSWIIFSHNLK